MRRRLYLQIYAAFLGAVALSVCAAAATAWLVWEPNQVSAPVRGAVVLLLDGLPPTDDTAFQPAFDDLARQLHARLGLWDAQGRLLAQSGGELPAPPPGCAEEGWFHAPQGGGYRVRLDDGRCLAGVHPWHRHDGAAPVYLFPVLLGIMALACYPVARRITRRLERLQRGVERFGGGDLTARVPVWGRDEVADLARSFNAAADRVEGLMVAQRRVLAHASHELRSPLARVRMAFALLDDGDETDQERRQMLDGAARDIEELDQLIGDVLLAARLEAQERPRTPVDLGVLAAEEARRLGLTAGPGQGVVLGDPALLRRLIRNLLENAQRHAGGAEIWIEPLPEALRLVVADRGPGVPAEQAERIFEPFYRPPGHREGADGGVGLGLSLVRQIATAHGGRVSCRPREGGGSRFEVDLPCGSAPDGL